MKRRIGWIAAAIWLGMMAMAQTGFPKQFTVSGEATYNLAGERSRVAQYYIYTSEIVMYAPDGSRTGKDVYRLYLRSDPVMVEGKETFKHTCVQFFVQPNGAKEMSLPSLENWQYIPMLGFDGKNQVFGIDHDRFRNLIDSAGNALSLDKSYQIYNVFIDFYGFTSVFADRMPDGGGIQDLHKIGEKIVHSTAFSSGSAYLEGLTSEGSFFKNGEITLWFTGLSIVNRRPCALVGLDSGECSLKMIMSPMPDVNITTIGLSHYKGNIYKDIASNWVQKVTFDEILVLETTISASSPKIHSVVERNVLILNVSKDEFRRR